jgi:signal peptidase II
LFFIALDQLSKYVASGYGFRIIKNTGVAFSFLSGINPIFIALVLVVLLKYWRKNIWFVLIFAGGISNLIDRIRLGYVVDFIDLKFWPVFNLADVFITLGVLSISYAAAKSYFRRQ